MKQKLNYRWRLFLSVLLLVWIIIGVLVAYQYRNEVEFRRKLMRSELSMIDSRIIYAHEKGSDIAQFVEFLKQYYVNSLYNDVRVSVYDENDSLIAAKGEPLPLEHHELDVSQEFDPEMSGQKRDAMEAVVSNLDEEKMFFFTACKSNDGKVQVRTAMPYNISINHAMTVDRNLWLVVLVTTLLATLTIFLSTRLLGRSITMLRNFARKAASGEEISEIGQLPHDEIGDISREIVNIYEQRLKAVEKSEREHRIALHAVEEKASLKRQMTNNINHELKTPIGVIRGYLETIAENPDMDDATRNHFMDRTRQNVERLCSLLNDVSAMTRLEDGAENIPLSEVNMYDLLKAVANDVKASHLCGDMTFRFEVPHDCMVLGNQGVISGVILNLIRNANFHSHGTEIMFRIISESKKFFVFAFYDNGIGVSSEHLPHLFERFYRIDSGRSRKVGGTGLGLPIVKSSIESLGGAISVHNRATGGLEFIFSLPKYNG